MVIIFVMQISDEYNLEIILIILILIINEDGFLLTIIHYIAPPPTLGFPGEKIINILWHHWWHLLIYNVYFLFIISEENNV